MDRVYCKQCKKVHRVIPADVMPYKQYEKEMILGVREGFITPDTYGFEDFPSEKQMDRWKREGITSFNEKEGLNHGESL